MRIVIQNFNRLASMQRLINWLKTADEVSHIVIFDNASDYPPLLDWYASGAGGCEVVRSEKNGGHLGVQTYLTTLPEEPIAVTDPDLYPLPECPRDLIPKCLNALSKIPQINKAGPGLDLSNIPRHYPFADMVIAHERKQLGKTVIPGIRLSRIDTTFAVYRVPAGFGNWRDNAVRFDWPYHMEHPDWHINPSDMDAEYAHYLSTSSSSGSYAMKLREWCDRNEIDWKKNAKEIK